MLSKLYFLYDKKKEEPVSNGGTRLYAYNRLAVARRQAGNWGKDVVVRQCTLSSEVNPNYINKNKST